MSWVNDGDLVVTNISSYAGDYEYQYELVDNETKCTIYFQSNREFKIGDKMSFMKIIEEE